ncbi:PepSY-associated TM helix domain-containing protein [Neopusillimonas aromaticivorans]|uniref:PepSY-associated TM helix domain-containing protein n=1 Tax=Neopusillimonas aromaticivorans TaxID=2979868 RepID=UPI002596872E|nr:PepSY-associated TM helix domain-containing protein [Neopusillimonas aromaticivorans]WJJ94642.1 PepSY-associated TM helix domain-containing protein [Neopusillimonas aromaticivorans]
MLPVSMNATTTKHRSKNAWMKTMHQWHWISAALSLAGLMLFAVTGITLNNASMFEGSPVTTRHELTVPADILRGLHARMHSDENENSNGPADSPANTEAADTATSKSTTASLQPDLENWLDQALGIRIAGRPAEVSADEIYVSLPEPGGDAWLAIDLNNGALEYERIHRGLVAYLNDLHKGRHSGQVWSWFIDLLAIACVVFAITGLFLLKIHGKNRPMTWPLTGSGLVIPLLIMLLLVH